MKLKCQLKGAKCPPYKHQGIFRANNETLTQFEPDMKRCATCMACTPPQLPSLKDDLLQIARITLWKKGEMFDPKHRSGASFGSFIRPQICGHLMNAKRKELTHFRHYRPNSYVQQTPQESPDTGMTQSDDFLINVVDVQVGFEDTLIWDMWNTDFDRALPQLLQQLTPREQQVFNLIRSDVRNCDIAKMLKLSDGRITQLTQQIEMKLKRVCQTLGLIE